jgi:VWFA-related protein
MRRVYSLRFIVGTQVLALLPLLIASTVQGQTNSGAGSGSSAAVSPDKIVKDVDEVPVDLVVHGKKKALLNLKPEDFAVTDNGSGVQLQSLRLMTGQSGHHLVTFLFDPLDPSAATNARDVAKKIMKVIPLKDFSFAVFNVDRRLRILEEFSANREEIQKAVSAATSDEGTEREETAAAAEKKLIAAVRSGAGQVESSTSNYDRGVERALLASLTESRRIVEDQHTPAPLAGLLALVRAQTKIPGRKLVIYFTEGVKAEQDRDILRSIAGAANRAEVSIYVINKEALDTKMMDGLMAAAAIGNAVASSRSAAMVAPAPTLQQTMAGNPQPFGPGLLSQITEQNIRIEGEGLAGNKDPMAAMAASTGGALIYSQDNLKRPFQQAVADLTTYYEGSYLPKELVYDGKFHQITVKPIRQGLKVKSRAGYFAVAPAGSVRAIEVPMLKAFSEPQLPTDVKFHTSVLQLGNLTTGNENTLVVEVPTSGLEVRRDPNANLASWHVSIVSEVKDRSGAVLEHFSQDVPGHNALDAKEEARSCATMQRHFALPPGEYTVETAVLDRTSGKLGAARMQFEVADAATGPFLSDVALVRRVDSSDDELDALEPLRYQHGKVVPSLSGQVLPGSKETSFFFLVRPDSAVSDPAMLEMQVFRNGELLGQMPLQLPANLSEAFPYLASLKTSSLPAGNYAVRVSLAQGERVIEREGSFSIPGPAWANAATGKPETVAQSDEAVADSAPAEAAIAISKRQPLVITALPPDAVTRPSEQEVEEIIAGARKQATNYSAKLPNFLCVEVTDRSVDSSGNGKWRRKDSFGELLRYVDNQETRTTLEVDGHPSREKRADMNGPMSLGEFGHLLSLVFEPSSKAEFHWKETDALANGTVQVFEYRVDRRNDGMLLSDNSAKIYSGFHGLAYIDSSTLGIRRITMEADDLPADFSMHAASIAIDYDYVTVGAHDYLMPVRGTIKVKRGRHEADLNQVVFQDYRRFASQSRIITKP